MISSGRCEPMASGGRVMARGIRIATALVLGIAALAQWASAADTLPDVALSKTKLVVKLRSDDRLAVKSRFEQNPPTIIIEFPPGRVAGSLPERSVVEQGVIREIRTQYASSASESPWIKSLSIELKGRYSYSVRPEPGQIVVEIEHPQEVATGAFEVGLANGIVVGGEAPPALHERFRAMQAALLDATGATSIEAPAWSTKPELWPTPTPQPRPRPGGISRTPPIMTAGRPSMSPVRTAALWISLVLTLVGVVGMTTWGLTRHGGLRFGGRRGERGTMGLAVIDELVWRAFEQQGASLVETRVTETSAAPLRIFTKDEMKAALQCVSGSAFFEKATVDHFAQAMRAAGASQGYLVAAGSFTVPAQRFAKEHNISLISREQLTELLSAGALQERYARHLKDVDGQLESVRNTLTEYAKQLDTIRRQRNEACWLLGEERAKASKLEVQRDEAGERATRANAEAEQWKATAALNHKQWEESQWYLGESRAYAEHLETQLRSLRENAAQLQAELDELGRKFQDAERQREEANWYLSESRSAQSALQEQVTELINRVKAVQEELSSAQRDLAKSRELIEAERQLRAELEAKLSAQMAGERRKGRRRIFRDAMLELQTGDDATIFRGAPKDVSAGGFRLGVSRTTALPERARVRLAIPGISKVVESSGRLVWQREDRKANERVGGYQFVDLPQEISNAVEQALSLPG